MMTSRTASVKQGDVIITRGTGNAPGAGGIISIVVVDDTSASAILPSTGGFKCRDATPAEIQKAVNDGTIKTQYC